MIKLVAVPHNETFQVFEYRWAKGAKHGGPGLCLGTIDREELISLIDKLQIRAMFDGEHEDTVRRFLRAKDHGQTLFQEAIEGVK